MAPTLAGSKVVASSDCKFAKLVEMTVGSTMPPNQGDRHCKHTAVNVSFLSRRMISDTDCQKCAQQAVGIHTMVKRKLQLLGFKLLMTKFQFKQN